MAVLNKQPITPTRKSKLSLGRFIMTAPTWIRRQQWLLSILGVRMTREGEGKRNAALRSSRVRPAVRRVKMTRFAYSDRLGEEGWLPRPGSARQGTWAKKC